MPRGDRTGPVGMGPMSGRAAGFCSGAGMPGFANALPGRGFGMGYGRGIGARGRGWSGGGHGRRNGFYATGMPGWRRSGAFDPVLGYAATYQRPDPEMEKQALRNQAEALQSELEMIHQRISALETGKPEQ